MGFGEERERFDEETALRARVTGVVAVKYTEQAHALRWAVGDGT